MSFKQIQAPVFIWVQGPGDPDPDYGQPAWGGRPDNSLPGGGQIDNSLPDAPGHMWGALIRWLNRPQIGGGPAKPPGLRPVVPGHDLPSGGHPGNRPPNSGRPPHPWRPGHWEPIDPGEGKPPLWAFFPDIDNGLPDVPEPPTTKPLPPEGPPVIGGGPVTPPPTHKPTPPGQGGAWFPTDPDFGKPVRPCPPVGGKPHPPLWGWVPDRPDNTLPPEGSGGTTPPATTTTTFYPSATVTVLASGGSGSINVTVDPAGSWRLDPASVPGWVTINPVSGDMATNLVYSASVNTTGVPKQALIKVNEAVLTINQGAV